MGTLHIGHAPHTGTIITGTSIKDGAGLVLRTLGWRWARTFNHWYVPGSRHSELSLDLVILSKERLESAGFEVIVDDLWGSTQSGDSNTLTREAQRVRRQMAKMMRTIRRVERSLEELGQQLPRDAARISSAEQLLAAERAALFDLKSQEQALNEAGAQIFTLGSLEDAAEVLHQGVWLRIFKVNRSSVVVSVDDGLRKLRFLDLEAHRTAS